MSRKLLAFLLSELATIRIICRNGMCGAITEIPINRLADTMKANCCPVCRSPFCNQQLERPPNWLARLAEVLTGLQKTADLVDVEFVLPDNAEQPAAARNALAPTVTH